MAIERQGAFGGARTVDRGAVDVGLRKYMLGVYNYMASGVLLTGIVAFMVASSPAMLPVIFGTPLKWVVIFSPLVFVLAMTFGLNRFSATPDRNSVVSEKSLAVRVYFGGRRSIK